MIAPRGPDINNNDQDYFEELSIPRDADQRAIKDACRRLARK
jgi:curved DNA-binding protein CbpA